MEHKTGSLVELTKSSVFVSIDGAGVESIETSTEPALEMGE